MHIWNTTWTIQPFFVSFWKFLWTMADVSIIFSKYHMDYRSNTASWLEVYVQAEDPDIFPLRSCCDRHRPDLLQFRASRGTTTMAHSFHLDADINKSDYFNASENGLRRQYWLKKVSGSFCTTVVWWETTFVTAMIRIRNITNCNELFDWSYDFQKCTFF